MKKKNKKYDGMNSLSTTLSNTNTDTLTPYTDPAKYIESISIPQEIKNMYDHSSDHSLKFKTTKRDLNPKQPLCALGKPGEYYEVCEREPPVFKYDYSKEITSTNLRTAIMGSYTHIVQLLIETGEAEVTLSDILLAQWVHSSTISPDYLRRHSEEILILLIQNYKGDIQLMAFILLYILLYRNITQIRNLYNRPKPFISIITESILKETIKRKINIFKSSGDIEACSVCFENYDDSSKECIVFLCGHNYHKECAIKWFKISGRKNCFCGTNINPESISSYFPEFPPYLTCKDYKELIQQREQLVKENTDGIRKRRRSKSRRRKIKSRRHRSKSKKISSFVKIKNKY
jgi:hypothetical protein